MSNRKWVVFNTFAAEGFKMEQGYDVVGSEEEARQLCNQIEKVSGITQTGYAMIYGGTEASWSVDPVQMEMDGLPF